MTPDLAALVVRLAAWDGVAATEVEQWAVPAVEILLAEVARRWEENAALRARVAELEKQNRILHAQLVWLASA